MGSVTELWGRRLAGGRLAQQGSCTDLGWARSHVSGVAWWLTALVWTWPGWPGPTSRASSSGRARSPVGRIGKERGKQARRLEVEAWTCPCHHCLSHWPGLARLGVRSGGHTPSSSGRNCKEREELGPEMPSVPPGPLPWVYLPLCQLRNSRRQPLHCHPRYRGTRNCRPPDRGSTDRNNL